MSNIFGGVILTIFSILTFAAGVILLVIGLSKKKKGLWISGIFLLGGAMISFIPSILFYIGMNQMQSNYQDIEYAEPAIEATPPPTIKTNFTPATDSLLILNFNEAVLIAFKDTYSPDSIFLPVYVQRKLTDKGLDVIDVKGLINTDNKKGIRLLIRFDQDFNGKIMLEAFGPEEQNLGTWTQSLRGTKGSEKATDFFIGDDVFQLELAYSTITIFI